MYLNHKNQKSNDLSIMSAAISMLTTLVASVKVYKIQFLFQSNRREHNDLNLSCHISTTSNTRLIKWINMNLVCIYVMWLCKVPFIFLRVWLFRCLIDGMWIDFLFINKLDRNTIKLRLQSTQKSFYILYINFVWILQKYNNFRT